MRPLEYLLGEPELVPVCRDLSKLLKLNQLFWAGLCRALGWPEPDAVFQGNHQTLMALKCQNIEPISYSTPNIPQHPVCDLTTGFTLSFQVNFPVFPWLCCLWFRTKHCAEGFRSLHCWTWFCINENQHSFIVPLLHAQTGQNFWEFFSLHWLSLT